MNGRFIVKNPWLSENSIMFFSFLVCSAQEVFVIKELTSTFAALCIECAVIYGYLSIDQIFMLYHTSCRHICIPYKNMKFT